MLTRYEWAVGLVQLVMGLNSQRQPWELCEPFRIHFPHFKKPNLDSSIYSALASAFLPTFPLPASPNHPNLESLGNSVKDAYMFAG